MASVEMVDAKVEDVDCNLGGITANLSMDYVKEIYGEPKVESRVDTADGKTWTTYVYGNSFYIKTLLGEAPDYPYEVVKEITVTANNGITTPQGLHVGNTAEEVFHTYRWEPDRISKTHGTPYAISGEQKKYQDGEWKYVSISHEWRDSTNARGVKQGERELIYTIEKGKVVQIKLVYVDW